MINRFREPEGESLFDYEVAEILLDILEENSRLLEYWIGMGHPLFNPITQRFSVFPDFLMDGDDDFSAAE